MQTDPSDLMTLLIALIAMITGREVAALVGPYAAICVVAVAGAGVALSKQSEKMNNWDAAKYVSFRVLMAVCFTVSLAEFLQSYLPSMKPRATLLPAAFLIAWVKDYNAIASWAWDRAKAIWPSKEKPNE